ncbi:MAG: acetylornithine transaminase [Salinisphaera sp.]|nr:acetylornithine transaminase [Salinisphaera sp.]
MQQQHLLPTYRHQPLAFTEGQGAWLTDENGRRYLDALAGIAVSSLGHGHPRLVDAITEQANRYLHCSNLYAIPMQETLAERLCDLAEMEAVFFCNSGAEANEAAIKIARRHGVERGIEQPAIVVMEGAFHGRTLATLAATASSGARAGFGPLPEGFLRVPFGDAAAVEALPGDSNITAVLVEPIQGEAGVCVPPDDYLRALRKLCDDNGWLLMFDEVQTGVGRTGQWFAHQHEDVDCDVMTLAKGLGGGVPIGAALVRGAARDLLGPGSHGSTFGGNPLACAAATAVVDTITDDGLVERAAGLGAWLLEEFRRGLAGCKPVRDIRGRGLMLGIELDRPAADLVDLARDDGLLVNVTAERVLRLLPPLVLSDADAAQLAQRIPALIRRFVEGG